MANNIGAATCPNNRFEPVVLGTSNNRVMYICEWCNENAYETNFFTSR
jgi:hypothetical protein